LSTMPEGSAFGEEENKTAGTGLGRTLELPLIPGNAFH
jgi:hypothetical protein